MSKETTVSDILSTLQTELKAPKGQDNKFGNYKYRKAEDILQAYKEEIKTADKFPKGITLKHKVNIELIGNRTFVKCISILAFNGQEEEAEGFAELELSKKGMDLAQLTGAATSYAKKYALGNLFAIDDSKDDPDGQDNTKEKLSEKPKEIKPEPINKTPEKSPLQNLADGCDEELREAKEAYRLTKLKESIDALGSKDEIDKFLAYKHNGKTRLEILQNMSEINAAEAKRIIDNAKMVIDNQGLGE